MLAASTWVSENIGWPIVGLALFAILLGIAVAMVAYEITDDVRRKRRIERREAGQRGGES